MITIEQAKALKPGDYVHTHVAANRDGSPQRFKVNGVPQTWKTRPDHVRVPLKHGLYEYIQLWHNDLHMISLGPGYDCDGSCNT